MNLSEDARKELERLTHSPDTSVRDAARTLLVELGDYEGMLQGPIEALIVLLSGKKDVVEVGVHMEIPFYDPELHGDLPGLAEDFLGCVVPK